MFPLAQGQYGTYQFCKTFLNGIKENIKYLFFGKKKSQCSQNSDKFERYSNLKVPRYTILFWQNDIFWQLNIKVMCQLKN
jgi:hypothetical protein